MTGNSRTAIPSDGTHSTARLLDIAKLGYAQWLFGNIYESVVKIPERLATDPNRTSVLGPGSPLRYYAPVLPVTVQRPRRLSSPAGESKAPDGGWR
jgi:hypothetical protein